MLDNYDMANQKICIVSPWLAELGGNKDAAYHARNLTALFTQNGASVTVLHTGALKHKQYNHIVELYKNEGVTFICLDRIPRPDPHLSGAEFLQNSFFIYQYFRSQKYDQIYFCAERANAFHTLQAKKTTACFDQTFVAVIMHAPSEWGQAQGLQWHGDPLNGSLMQWCERYCCRNCDYLISPSHYMFQWAMGCGWELNQNRQVLRYFSNQEHGNPQIQRHRDQEGFRLVFWGDIASKNEVNYIFDALKLLDESLYRKIESITFLGLQSKSGQREVKQNISRCVPRIKVDILPDSSLDNQRVLSLTGGNNTVVYYPSLQSNYPYELLNLLSLKVRLRASHVGGIPELLPSHALFEPTAQGLADSLSRVLASDAPQSGPLDYDPKPAMEGWLELAANCHGHSSASPKDAAADTSTGGEQPRVSICIPYYNYGKYIKELLLSIQGSTYGNYEVILVNDGSPDQESRSVFEELARQNKNPNYTFMTIENSGVGVARNKAASVATGEYLIFVDADNLVSKEMIGTFVSGMQKCGADALTCHFAAFPADAHPSQNHELLHYYMPVGPALETGILQNIFGDANFIIKKKVFDEMGGFADFKGYSFEDWEFLARLALKGYRQDVIPECLFWYRITPQGKSRRSHSYLSHRKVMSTYAQFMPSLLHYQMMLLLGSYHYKNRHYEIHNRTIEHLALKIAHVCNEMVDRLIPLGSKRRIVVHNLVSRYIKK